MSIGPTSGIVVSAAGTSLAQAAGADVDRARQDASSQQLRSQNEVRAENAAGIGATDGEEHGTNDRDADGRRLWELPAQARHQPEATAADEAAARHAIDVTGAAGQMLDLTG